MKIINITLLLFLTGIAQADTIYRCNNAYGPEPCYDQINKLLQYTPTTQAQLDVAEFAQLQRELIDNVEHSKLQTLGWQQLAHARQMELANQAYLERKLQAFIKKANYRRAEAILHFKQGREYEIHKAVKDRDNEMLDNIAWQSIHHDDDIVWHKRDKARRTPWLSERRR